MTPELRGHGRGGDVAFETYCTQSYAAGLYSITWINHFGSMPYNGRLETTPLLDIVQIIAYSQQSGLLSIKGSTKGLIIFQGGNIVCAYSPSALPLLVKAAKEQDPDSRLSLRRIQVLAALRELFELANGDYRFVKRDEPIGELEGLDVRLFYESGTLDTGDLLLVLERAMDEEPQQVEVIPPSPEKPSKPREERVHPRYGPVVIQATLEFAGTTVAGYLTNLSEGGTFFNADEFPGPDSECELGFELPWELGHCEAKANVAWLRAEGPGTRRGVGLSFVELSPESKDRIAAYLERFQELAADVDFDA